MAERLAYLEAVVGADITQFRKGMRDIRNEMGVLSETMRGVAAVGRTMTFTLTAPLVTLGTYAVQAATGFDESMRNINAIAQLTEQQFGSLRQEVLEFAKTTTAGVVPATNALYEVFSAGVTDVETAMELWQQSIKVAEAGLADFEATTNAVTATIAAYGLEAKDAASVGDVWTHMVALGVGSMNDFLANSQKVLPLSNALGISFEELGAAAAYMSQQGGGAKKAMTALAMLESNLLKPNLTLAAAYEKLGVVTGKQLVEKFGSLFEAITAIQRVSTEGDLEKMFSKTGVEAVLSITNNVDRAKASLEEFQETVGGATDRAWEQQAMSFAFAFKQFRSAAEGVAVIIGDQIVPLILPMVKHLTALANSLSSVNPQFIQFGVVVAGAVAAAGPILWLLGSILTPIGLLSGAMAGLALTFANNWDEIKTTVETAAKDILGTDLFAEAGSIFDEVVATLFPESEQASFIQSVQDAVPAVPLGTQGHTLVTVEPGDTLWDIFKEGGWDNVYDWETFKEITGLDNPAMIKPGDVIEIPYNLGDQVMAILNRAMQLAGGGGVELPPGLQPSDQELLFGGGMTNLGGTGNAIADPILERIRAALDIVVARFGPIVDEALTRIAAWFDDKVGVGLLNLSRLFEPGEGTGEQPVYDAVKALLDGDITRAIDEIIPGLGTKIKEMIEGWGTTISDNTGSIQTGAKTLFDSLGKWLETNAIPTVARSIGFIVGKLTTLLNSAISSIWSSLTTGGGAEGVASFFSDAIATPFSEGYQDALGEAGVTPGVDQLFTSLEAALLGAATLWVLAPGVVDAIAGGIGRGLKVLTFVDSLVTPVFDTLGNTLLRVLNRRVPILGRVAEAIGLKILAAKVALTPLSGEDIIDVIGGAIKGAAGAISSATSWVVSTATSIVSAVGGAMAAGLGAIKAAILGVGSSMLLAVGPIIAVGIAIAGVIKQLEVFQGHVRDAASAGTAGGANIRATSPNAFPTPEAFDDAAFAELAKQHGDLYARYLWSTATFQVALHKAKEEYFDVGTAAVTGLDEGITAGLTSATQNGTDLGNALTQGAKDTLVANSPSMVFDAIGQDIILGLMQGMLAQEPALLAQLLMSFGPESPFMLTFTAMKDSLSIKFGEIVVEFSNFGTVATSVMAGVAAQLKPSIDIVVKEISRIETAVKDAAAAMAALKHNAGQYTVDIDLPGRALGGPVKAGQMYQVGERGPEAFVPGVDGQIIPNNMLSKGGGGGGGTYNEIHLHEVSDVDRILFEFKRRGIKL